MCCARLHPLSSQHSECCARLHPPSSQHSECCARLHPLFNQHSEYIVLLSQMRHVFLILDASRTMVDKDLKPDRITCTLKVDAPSVMLWGQRSPKPYLLEPPLHHTESVKHKALYIYIIQCINWRLLEITGH